MNISTVIFVCSPEPRESEREPVVLAGSDPVSPGVVSVPRDLPAQPQV